MERIIHRISPSSLASHVSYLNLRSGARLRVVVVASLYVCCVPICYRSLAPESCRSHSRLHHHNGGRWWESRLCNNAQRLDLTDRAFLYQDSLRPFRRGNRGSNPVGDAEISACRARLDIQLWFGSIFDGIRGGMDFLNTR